MRLLPTLEMQESRTALGLCLKNPLSFREFVMDEENVGFFSSGLSDVLAIAPSSGRCSLDDHFTSATNSNYCHIQYASKTC